MLSSFLMLKSTSRVLEILDASRSGSSGTFFDVEYVSVGEDVFDDFIHLRYTHVGVPAACFPLAGRVCRGFGFLNVCFAVLCGALYNVLYGGLSLNQGCDSEFHAVEVHICSPSSVLLR